MKPNPWTTGIGLALCAILTQTAALGQDTDVRHQTTTHRKATRATSSAHPQPADRMTREEVRLVQKRLATIHRKEAKKFNQRAFDRDFDRITARYNTVPSASQDNENTQDPRYRNAQRYSQGRVIRDAETGESFLLP